jgi:hypothetical protein
MPDTWKHFAEQHPDRIISDSGVSDSVPGTESDSAPRASPERDMQQALIDLCAAREAEYPALEWIYATPNGQYRPGQRMEPGLKSGVPDVFLPAPAGGYHGLYLELKSATGRVRDAQRRWIDGLRYVKRKPGRTRMCLEDFAQGIELDIPTQPTADEDAVAA